VPSESLDDLLDCRLCLGAVGDVRCHHQRGAAGRVDLGGDAFESVPAEGDKLTAAPCWAS
jgi:hypothetical protein